LEKKSNNAVDNKCFLGWFQVLGPSLVGVQKAGCVMFGITGTGLGSTQPGFLAGAGTPDLEPRRDRQTALLVDVELGTRSQFLGTFQSSINEACKNCRHACKYYFFPNEE